MFSTAEEVAGSLDMIWEILIRLPLKSLLRLKCVSKQWLTLISDQGFRDSYSLHHQKYQRYTTSLIFSSSNYANGHSPHSNILDLTATTPTPRVLNLDFLNQLEVVVVRSCNGLLLCCGQSPSTYFICNPVTRDFTTVDLVGYSFPCKRIGLYLSHDPSIPHHYKVISIAQLNWDLPRDWVFNVYSFKTRWQISPTILLSIPIALDAADGVYCNHAIHWCREGEFSVYFDIETQTLKRFPMPLSDLKWLDRCVRYFGESGGRLHLMITVGLNFNFMYESYDHVYDIFELKEDYSGWTLRHRVDLNFLQGEFSQISWHWRHLSFYIVRTVKNEMLVLIVGKEGALFYDPGDESSRKLCDFKKGTTASFHIQDSIAKGGVLQYFETYESFVRV